MLKEPIDKHCKYVLLPHDFSIPHQRKQIKEVMLIKSCTWVPIVRDFTHMQIALVVLECMPLHSNHILKQEIRKILVGCRKAFYFTSITVRVNEASFGILVFLTRPQISLRRIGIREL